MQHDQGDRPTPANDGSIGSDDETALRGASSGTGAFVDDGAGNFRLDSPVSWFTTSDDDDGDPNLAHSLDARAASTVADRDDDVLQEDQDRDDLSYVYREVTVPGGGTLSYLLFVSMRADDAAAQDAAEFLDAQPAEAFTGLTDDEFAPVQNWNGDNDNDGVRNDTGNCPAVANGGQADLDGDGRATPATTTSTATASSTSSRPRSGRTRARLTATATASDTVRRLALI